jgi:selenocysteine-specific elongation factor
MSELLPKSISVGISENKLMQILALLCKQRKLYCIDDNYLHFTVVEKYRFVLLNYLEKHSEGITVAQFRDLINGNRKLCLLLLTQYDREGYTSREGDLRFISEKGIKLLRQRDNN